MLLREAMQTLARYWYDGDGTLVKSEIDGRVTYYAGRYYHKEVSGGSQTIRKFYFAGATQVAVRSVNDSTDILNWILSDHLGSTSVTAAANGTLQSEIRYKAFGEVRSSSGDTFTPYQYTGQLSQMEEIKLYYYVARWYDPVTAHFAQVDTIVPDINNSLDWNRYSYAHYNPIRYSDPTGHKICDGAGINGVCDKSGVPSTLAQVKIALKSYDVVLVTHSLAEWTFHDAYSAYLGVYDLGNQLSRVTKKEATEVFKQAYGPMTFTIRNDISYFGVGSNGNIDVKLGRVTPRLTIHELGHSFERHMWQNAGGAYKANNPVQMLIDKGVYDANKNLITGKGNRYNGLKAPENGYVCDSYIGECQYHSKDVDEYWNETSEDFADMLMNWTYKSFARNLAGDALYNWIETNMASWIK